MLDEKGAGNKELGLVLGGLAPNCALVGTMIRPEPNTASETISQMRWHHWRHEIEPEVQRMQSTPTASTTTTCGRTREQQETRICTKVGHPNNYGPNTKKPFISGAMESKEAMYTPWLLYAPRRQVRVLKSELQSIHDYTNSCT